MGGGDTLFASVRIRNSASNDKYLFADAVNCSRNFLVKHEKKNIVNFRSDTHISDVKMNPFNTFGPDVFTYLKQICVQIKENTTGKTASGF